MPDHFVESLERLSKKNGVLGTIVIDRSNGVILNTSGSLLSIRAMPTGADSALPEGSSTDLSDQSGMQDMARMVWNYMAATRELVQGLDSQVFLQPLTFPKYVLI